MKANNMLMKNKTKSKQTLTMVKIVKTHAPKQESNIKQKKKRKKKNGINKALKISKRLIKRIGERFTRKLQLAKFIYLYYH